MRCSGSAEVAPSAVPKTLPPGALVLHLPTCAAAAPSDARVSGPTAHRSLSIGER